ncbi:MAG: hypothetical protein PHX87_06330 [Candidatus Peribacteraceae bacterium]|nr:hypothetical protein [Candidatus Peribacteraceae bacterium]MDD5743008.1 hypothetical protein [Candidatus Peribacteraceae bacterium]
MKPERIRIGRRGSPPLRERRAQWPFRFTLILLGGTGIAVSLLVAYRGNAPGQLPWNVAGGSGAPSDPYRVATCAELQNLSAAPAASYALAEDIDCAGFAARSSGQGFVPIGTSKTGFTGTLDGRGFAIRNLVIRRAGEDAVGLFSLLGSGASVSRLSLTVDIAGHDGVGGLAGRMEHGSTATEVIVSGTVEGHVSVGGIAGVSRGSIRTASGGMAVTGEKGVGGIAGTLDEGGDARTVAVSGTVIGGEDVGGVAGVGRGALIDGCVVTGTVRGTQNTGGAVGWLIGGTERASSIVNCYFSGQLRGATQKDILVGKRGVQ